ncbi:MAG: glycosyltransferase family 2 protein [Candidatus Rokuibacteriota bacterium]
MGLDHHALAHAILADIAPATVSVIGEGYAPLVDALGAGRCEAGGSRPDDGAPEERRRDLVVWLVGPAGAAGDPRPAIERLCATSDDVVLALPAGSPGAVWSEGFAEHGFYVDPDFQPPVGERVVRMRKASARRAGDERLRAEVRRLQEEADGAYRRLDEQDRQIAAVRQSLAAIEHTLGWRVVTQLRRARDRAAALPGFRQLYLAAYRTVEVLIEDGPSEVVRKAGHKASLALRGRSPLVEVRDRVPRDLDGQYPLWLERHAPRPRDLEAMGRAVGSLPERPLVTIVAVVDHDEDAAAVVETLRGQVYPDWELSLVRVAAAAAPGTPWQPALDEPRAVTATSPDAGTAYQDALGLARGAFVGFVEPGDALAPEALFEMVRHLGADPGLDVIYTDEDVVERGGRRMEPFFKPDWSPDLLLSTNYLARLGLVRRKLVDEVGGFRPELAGGQCYDLMLRLTERTARVGHVPKVLYHRRRRIPTSAGVAAYRSAALMEGRAIEDALRRRGLSGSVTSLAADVAQPRYYAPRLRLRSAPLVSIIIPTRDKQPLLERCVRSIREKTAYEHYEIVVVDNDSAEPDTLAYLQSVQRYVRVVQWPGRFNFSAINNFGVTRASGEQLLFLNNDIEVLDPDWLAAMLEHAQRPEVGAVGAKLLYPDGRIQHAGVVVGIARAAAHAYRLWPGEAPAPPRLADVVRNWSAVTAACMMMPRRVFEEVGGFDERLRVVLNDVDLCLRIRERGYLVVYTPWARLCHYEGATRGRLHPTPDERLFQERWAAFLDRGDPYYNPNFSDERDDWTLRL